MLTRAPRALTALALAAGSASALPQSFPLPATAGDRTALEDTAPFLLPATAKQTRVVDRASLSLQGLPSTFGTWDMLSPGRNGRFLVVPTEVGSGAGVFRYDPRRDRYVTLMRGNGSGSRTADPAAWDPHDDDFSRLDPATLTPWNTILTAEETTGGRLFEILDPFGQKDAGGNDADFEVVWRSSIPAVSHEGLRFDAEGNLYFIDENVSGSIYRFVPGGRGPEEGFRGLRGRDRNRGGGVGGAPAFGRDALQRGQTFVLSVDAYAADPTVDPGRPWNSSLNPDALRFGPARWVPITDPRGVPLTRADPFAFVTRTGGRSAADEVKGTPYGRPEDITFGHRLASGNEVFYVSTTSENRVLSIELTGPDTAFVRVFVDYDTINLATRSDVNPLQDDPYTSPGPSTETNFNAPDNLATDVFGTIYVVEDQNPGDIWKTVDADRDGVAEGMGLWASLGVAGSEPSGLIPDPENPRRFLVQVQHPASGNDALWAIETED